MRILFQGDSITDASRDRRSYHKLGSGYAKVAAELIREAHPEKDIEFINLGIGGNRTDQLFDRLYKDAIELQPDIISILIGINDVWHRYGKERIATTDEQIKLNYTMILKELRAKTNAKIMIMTPYLLDCDDKDAIREDLKTVLPIVRELAAEYADVFVPLDEYFEEALKTMPEPRYYSADGVHPNQNGAAFIGKLYAEAIEAIL
jgi:lysophospholipase L1-like esterase